MKNVVFDRSRIVWMDNVRMFAMVCVMLGHTWRLIDCPLPVWLGDFILAFNMPLFVLISGFMAAKSLGKINNWSDFLWYMNKISKRIMIPAVMFCYSIHFLISLIKCDIIHTIKFGTVVVCLLALCYNSQYITSRIKILRGGILSYIGSLIAIACGLYANDFWFLIMLFCVMTVAALSSMINKKIVTVNIQKYSLPIIAFAVSLLFNFVYDKTSDFILYYFIGYYLSITDVLKNRFINNKFAPWGLLLCGIFLLERFDKDMMNFWDFHFWQFLTIKPFYLYILRHICAVCISAFFVLTIKSISSQYNIFSFMGTLTLPLYMVHAFTIRIIKTLHIQLQLNDWQYMCYAIPTTTIWVIVCSLIILYTLRNKLIREMYWGMV